MLPAAGLILGWKSGLQMPSDPIIPIPFLEWAYIDMTQHPFFGTALAVIITVLVTFGFAYYGLRRVNENISVTKSMLPIVLFLMIMPLVLGPIFLVGWPGAPHPLTHIYLGATMIVSAVLVDIATTRAMLRKRTA